MSNLVPIIAVAVAYLALAGVSTSLAYAPTDAWTVWLASGLTLGLIVAQFHHRWMVPLAGAAIGAAVFALILPGSGVTDAAGYARLQNNQLGKRILFTDHHDWTDEQATTILRNCRRAFDARPDSKRTGRVVLLEFVVPPGNEPHPSKIIDIEMLFFPGGRERMEQEWRELFAGAGFRLTRIVPTKSPFSVIEAEIA